jgi:hypothetical protein
MAEAEQEEEDDFGDFADETEFGEFVADSVAPEYQQSVPSTAEGAAAPDDCDCSDDELARRLYERMQPVREALHLRDGNSDEEHKVEPSQLLNDVLSQYVPAPFELSEVHNLMRERLL